MACRSDAHFNEAAHERLLAFVCACLFIAQSRACSAPIVGNKVRAGMPKSWRFVTPICAAVRSGKRQVEAARAVDADPKWLILQ